MAVHGQRVQWQIAELGIFYCTFVNNSFAVCVSCVVPCKLPWIRTDDIQGSHRVACMSVHKLLSFFGGVGQLRVYRFTDF